MNDEARNGAGEPSAAGWGPASDDQHLLPAVRVAGGSLTDSPQLDDGSWDAVAVPVGPAVAGDDHLQPGEGVIDVAARYGIDLADLAERAGLTGAAGEAHTVQLPRPVGSAVSLPWDGLPPRVVLVGVGSGSTSELRRAGAALAKQTRGLGVVATTLGLRAADGASRAATAARAVAEGYLLASRPPLRRPGRLAKPSPGRSADLVLLGRDGTRPAAALDAARVVAASTWLARDLTATPASTKTPAWLADQAVRLARAAGLRSHVLGASALTEEGFGGLLAVGSGSSSPPRLVTVSYDPPAVTGGGAARHVVVVGKGITFDTGGLSIKPREGMVTMKTDMAGAAVALATVLGAAAAGSAHRVTAVLALAENHVGAASYRPADVVRIYGGTTVEVTNTDAEGRLVLADGLAYAADRLAPDVLLDVATLTGAQRVALGLGRAALFSPDDELAGLLAEAGEASGEPVWRMPLVDEYAWMLDSSIAQLRQASPDPHAGAGAVFAAMFLHRFVGDHRWAHLDIAGPARSSAEGLETPEGSTGYGVRLLLDLLTRLP